VIDQIDEKSAMRGSFGLDRVEKLKTTLKQKLHASIRLAMMHHHPILHTGFIPDVDVIPTGDAILAALKDNGCHFVVHGHKHLARLTCMNDIIVFAAGSFSADLQVVGSSMGNMFHVIELQQYSQADLTIRGRITTWTFQYGTGWIESNLRYRGFPFLTGFGRTSSLKQMADELSSHALSHSDRDLFLQEEVLAWLIHQRR
jgi:hypothetical protein